VYHEHNTLPLWGGLGCGGAGRGGRGAALGGFEGWGGRWAGVPGAVMARSNQSKESSKKTTQQQWGSVGVCGDRRPTTNTTPINIQTTTTHTSPPVGRGQGGVWARWGRFRCPLGSSAWWVVVGQAVWCVLGGFGGGVAGALRGWLCKTTKQTETTKKNKRHK